MPRDNIDPNQLTWLAEVFRQIGLDDPETLARAELSQGIPRLVLTEDEKPAHPLRTLVHLILLLSLRDRATEVGFEPRKDCCRLYYRIDDTVYDMVPPPRVVARRISQIFKVMTDLDICGRRTRKTGRVQVQVGGGMADLTVTAQPTEYGESIFVKVLESTVTAEDALNVIQGWNLDTEGREYFEFEIEGDAEAE